MEKMNNTITIIIKKWLSNIIEIDNIKHLNNKVEIIEEDKKIEKLSRCS